MFYSIKCHSFYYMRIRITNDCDLCYEYGVGSCAQHYVNSPKTLSADSLLVKYSAKRQNCSFRSQHTCVQMRMQMLASFNG